MDPGHPAPETMFLEASVEAPKVLAAVSDDVVAFPSQRAVAFVGDGPPEMLPIDAPGQVTAMSGPGAAGILAVVARSENPSVILVSTSDKTVRGVLNGAGSLDVDAVALSHDGTRALTFSSDEGYGAVAWDVATGHMLPGAAAHIPASPTTAASFHPRDRSLACAITPAGIFFWHITVSGDGSTRLQAIPGILPDEALDRIALSASAVAELRSLPAPVPLDGSDVIPPPATGLLSPEGLAMHGIAAAVDVASGAPDPASGAGLVPGSDTIPLLRDEAAGTKSLAGLASPTSAPSTVAAQARAAATAVAAAAGAGGGAGGAAAGAGSVHASAAAHGAAGAAAAAAAGSAVGAAAAGMGASSANRDASSSMPWEDDSGSSAANGSAVTGSAVAWSEAMTSGASAPWLGRRRFISHCWLPDGRVLAGVASGWLLLFDPVSGCCVGAAPPPAPGVRVTALLTLADAVLVGRSDGRIESRALPALEVAGSMDLGSPSPVPLTLGSRRLASSAGVVRCLAPSPSFRVVFASTAAGGIFRIDLRAPGQDDDDDDAAAAGGGASGSASGAGRGGGLPGAADGGVAVEGLAAHGEMSSSVIGVARPLLSGPAGPVLALRPLTTPPPHGGDDSSASGGPRAPSLIAALDACGLLSVYDVATPTGTQIVASRRFVFEPAAIATSSGTAALPAPWEEEGSQHSMTGSAAGTSSAAFLASAAASGPGHAVSSMGGLATSTGLATMAGDGRTATPSLPVPAQCLDSHGRLPLLALGTDSGCIHLLVAASNGSERGCLTPASAGAVAPGVTLTDVAVTRAHTGAVTVVAFCPHPTLPLLAAVSDADRSITFHLVHVPDQAPALAADGGGLDGPLLLLPVGTASLPPAPSASHAAAPHPGQGMVCAACWRVDPSGSGAAELLVSLADGSIAAVAAPSLEAVEHARAAVDAAAAEGSGVSAALVSGAKEAHWPVDSTSSVLVHALDAGHAPPVVAMSTGPHGTGHLLAASPAVASVMLLPTPWAPGSGEAADGAEVTERTAGAAFPSAGEEAPSTARSQLSDAAAAAPPPPSAGGAGAGWRVAMDLSFGGGQGGSFPREASAGEEAGMLALAASATSSGLAVASVNAAGSAALAFVVQEAGGVLAGAGGSATPSVGRSAAAAPFHGTCVAVAPCGTRVVVGTTVGTVVVASVSDTRLRVFEAKAATPSADEAATGARFQLLAEAIGLAACLGSRAAFAGAPGQTASGALTSVSGAGEAAAWCMGVGMVAPDPSSDKGHPGDGWEAEMVQQSAPRDRSAAGGDNEESKYAFFESGPGSDDGANGADDGARSVDVAAAAAAAASCLEWAHSVEEARAEALAEPFREALRERLGELAHRVAELVETNAEAPELERLGREEFAVDEEGAAAHELATQRLVAKQLAATEADIAESEREAADLKRECWDAVEKPLEAVHSLGGGGEERVWSMAVRRLSPEDERLLGKLSLLRRMEQAEMADSAEGAVEELPGGDLAWPGLASDLPADADWLVNAGAIPPALDPVAQREALAQKQAKDKAEAAAAAAAAGASDGAAGAAGAAAAAAAAASAQADGSDTDEGGASGGAAGGNMVGRAAGWAGEGVTKLLYHPLSCRTGAQRRLQIRLLEQLTREVARSFNRRFDTLKQAKLDDAQRISERNKRATKILELLGRTEELYEPPSFDDEKPEALLEASREEVGFDEWEPAAVVKAREEEAQRRAAEAAKHKDDAPERALDDMMSGTLEEKDEVQRAEDAMRAGRQPWMDEVELALLARAGVMEAETAPVLAFIQAEALGQTPEGDVDESLLKLAKEALDNPESADSLPEEQRAPFRNYRARIAELLQLREARRIRLEEELASLKTEVKTIIEEFDARLTEAQQQYREFREAILVQEAYAHRLAAAVAGSDANLEREQYVLERLATFTTAADREASALPGAEQVFSEVQRQLEQARAVEADMERAFRDAVRSRSEHGLDGDTMRRLVDMFHHSRHDVSFELAGARAAALGRDPRRGAASVAREAVGELVTADGGTAAQLPHATGAGGGAYRGAASATLSHDPAAGAPTGPSPTEEELFAEAERRATAEPTSDMLPDDLVPGVTLDEAVWAEALERWRAKVVQELQVARLAAACDRAAAVVSSIRAALARAQGKVHALEDERNALLRANALTANDVDIMIRLRQGQDEVAGLAAIPDYGEALLVPTRVVESENVGTRRAGRRVARRLERVREARKDLRYRQWMREYAEGRMQDREEWMRDVSLLRVTKELQQFVGGADLAQKQKELTVKTEAQGRYLKTAHRRVMGKQQRAQKRLDRTVLTRREENERLLKQVTELEQSVAVRAGIVEARERGAGGGVGPTARADKRMGTLVARSRLVSTAKTQADELDALRAQLAKLRRRTFPMFVAGQS